MSLCYIARYTDVWKGHRESEIHDIHEIGSGTKLYYLWVRGYSSWGERDTIFLCWLLLHRQLSTQPTCGARRAQSRRATPRSEISTFQFGRRNSTNWLFSNLSPRFRCVASPTSPGLNSYQGFLFWHLWMTHPLRARAWTPALMLHQTNPCAKRKVLSLTKLKGKTYKTKSLSNYITFGWEKNEFLQEKLLRWSSLWSIIHIQIDREREGGREGERGKQREIEREREGRER